MPVFLIVAISVVLGASIALLPLKVVAAIALTCLVGHFVTVALVRSL